MVEQQVVHSRGIYHGLPVFPSTVRGLTAIITGANGISGHAMLKVLAQSPGRWSKIYCLSRRPPAIPEGLPKQAEHVPLDFLQEPEHIAKVLREKSIKADYVFFFSYIQTKPKEGAGLWSDAESMAEVNAALLNNFLQALPLASIQPKRIMLQTGAKNYGVHLGPAMTPAIETDPRVEIEPNFYYRQMDALVNHCSKQGSGWNEVRPSFILGAVPDAAMNLVHGLGIYASVCKHLQKSLEWPGSLEGWETNQEQSTAMMNAYLEEWAVLTDNAANEAFNAVDGIAFTWGRMWPKLAAWYGIEYTKPDLKAKYTEREAGYNPPPRGWGPKNRLKFTFTLTAWGKRPEVQQAWSELAAKHDLQDKQMPDPERVLAFADSALLGAARGMTYSMAKARKLGFFGAVDSSEAIHETLQDFVKMKVIPAFDAN